jgi:hypothetical protein
MWGPKSAAAAKAKGYNSIADAIYAMNHPDAPQGGPQPQNPNQNPQPAGGFTGSSYSEAVAYLESKNIPSYKASSIMTETEWQRRKNAGAGSAEVKNYNTYKEYLADIVEYMLSNG